MSSAERLVIEPACEMSCYDAEFLRQVMRRAAKLRGGNGRLLSGTDALKFHVRDLAKRMSLPFESNEYMFDVLVQIAAIALRVAIEGSAESKYECPLEM